MGRENLIELLELRLLLECNILSHALPNLRKADASAAEEVLNELEKSDRSQDVSKRGKMNWEFHKGLYLCANRPETLSEIEGITHEPFDLFESHMLHSKEFSLPKRSIASFCDYVQRDPAAIDYLSRHIHQNIKSLS
ncbi:hypothetical protein CK223_31045 [Mesorhizobium loti]|uniref:FCD domain-containing protein n=1 Tax=Rhizobium loti TaxID=381 RepID=UPI000BAED0C6|nr:hypothetical protein CK223_31045 [Mesorhizobium loti]QIA25268.1 FCD domain-containing protein [Mesorhizobium sp. AA22]